jgi:hypothetical protein
VASALLGAMPQAKTQPRELTAGAATRLLCAGDHMAIFGHWAKGLGYLRVFNILAALYGSDLAFSVITPTYNPTLLRPIIELAIEGQESREAETIYPISVTCSRSTCRMTLPLAGRA